MFAGLLFELPQFLQRRRRHEHDERLQIGRLQDLETVRVQVEDADLAAVDHGADGADAGAVVSPLVLAVLDEQPVDDVLLELRPRDEVVVLAVHLGVLPRPAGVCGGGRGLRVSVCGRAERSGSGVTGTSCSWPRSLSPPG